MTVPARMGKALPLLMSVCAAGIMSGCVSRQAVLSEVDGSAVLVLHVKGQRYISCAATPYADMELQLACTLSEIPVAELQEKRVVEAHFVIHDGTRQVIGPANNFHVRTSTSRASVEIMDEQDWMQAWAGSYDVVLRTPP